MRDAVRHSSNHLKEVYAHLHNLGLFFEIRMKVIVALLQIGKASQTMECTKRGRAVKT